MRSEGYLDVDVDLAKIAHGTKNYSGAEIEGVVKSAASFAFERNIDTGNLASATDIDSIRVTAFASLCMVLTLLAGDAG